MTNQQLAAALQLHQAGRLGEAEHLYREILSHEPEHCDALHLLGMIALQAGDPSAAVQLIRRAIALSPDFADYHNNLATALFRQSDYAGAETACREAIRLRPEFWQAQNNLGNALLAQQQFAAALAAYEVAMQQHPDYALAMANAAHACCKLEDTARAIELCQAALAIESKSPEAWNNLGDALMFEGRFPEAVDAFEQARRWCPDSAEIHDNLGNALQQMERWPDAIASHRQAIALRGDLAPAYYHLRNAYLAQGNLTEALESFRETTHWHPKSAAAHFHLANTCRDLQRLDEAEVGYRRALDLQPDFAAAMTNLAITLSDQGRTPEAFEWFSAARAASQDDPGLAGHWLVCLQYLPGYTPESLRKAHAEWDRQFSPRMCTDAQAERGRSAGGGSPTIQPRTIRVGFVSRDFRRHPVTFLLVGCLEHLDGQRVKSICFADVVAEDEWTERVRAASDTWLDVAGCSDAGLAERIAAEKIDVLIDLAGHTAGNRLLTFARKPAAVQATWLGYVGTTGLQAIDYLITDRFHSPAGTETDYCEQLLRMPDAYACYTPPRQAPLPGAPPATANKAPTFGCFSNPAKISDATLKLWSQILMAVPDSQLLLKYYGWQSDVARRVFRERCARYPIDPQRIRFEGPAPQEELLASYSQVDVALDTMPYSGGITTCEALWMGVPVVTLPGDTFASRHALSHLSNAGLSELVAGSEAEYVDLAVRVAADKNRLREYRHDLRPQLTNSALCQADRFARNFAAAMHRVAARAMPIRLPLQTGEQGP